MKRFVAIVLVVVLAVVAFGTAGCVDIDEALPHYVKHSVK